MIVAQDGPYYLTRTEGRQQPYTLRRTARWRNDYHQAHYTTIAFYASKAEAHAGLSAWVAREAAAWVARTETQGRAVREVLG